MCAELSQDRPRLSDRAGSIGRLFVPGGRRSQESDWVARTERADDEVVEGLAIGHSLETYRRTCLHRQSQLLDGGVGVSQDRLGE